MTSRYEATIILKKAMCDSAGNNSIFRAIKQWSLHPQATIQVSSCASGYQERDIDRAVQSQSAIGWTNLLRGLISIKWRLALDSNDLSSATKVPSLTTTNHLALSSYFRIIPSLSGRAVMMFFFRMRSSAVTFSTPSS
jgi:hypothetical protein